MSKQFSSKEAYKYYDNKLSITQNAKNYCKQINIEFKDNYRRILSTYITRHDSNIDQDLENESVTDTNQYTSASGILSALKEDGTIMNISEYCSFYNIPEEHVKSYKLVTHTGKGAYYNIASHSLKGDGFEEFYKNLLQEIDQISTRPKTIKRVNTDQLKEEHLLIVDPADCHIGKLASKFETGDEYNVDIAVNRILKGVEGILHKSKGFDIDQVLFVAGNDILHTDTPKRTTTSGTPQDTDGQWYTNFLTAKDVYIKVIDRLLEIANVHFVFNPSNHDWTHGFFLADVIKTYYKGCENITFDTTLRHRKYFVYYSNLIGSSHGDGAKQADLPLLMANESKDWSSCKHRYIYIHHFHHKISKDYVGVTVESLRSPSGTDGWHDRNGFTGVPKAIEGFIHSKTQGQIARITHIF